ncbi:MAG TPA: beta-ketoacyl-ACP synthase II [Myxococcaceae bacterium]|nr:beta-ketoacyl-ACP synthase II [Myxococcaceae bacterium]
MSARKVVITGLGLVTPLGTGVEQTWAAAIAGKSGVGPITRFDPGSLKTRIAAEVKDFDPLSWMDRKEARRTDRYVQLAMAAAEMAMRSSGLRIGTGPEQIRGERVGVILGSGIGGLASAEEAHEKALRTGFDRLSPMFVLELLSNTAAGMVSIRHGAAGPNYAPVAACSTGAHALGEALWSIRTGRSEAVIAGAAEAAVTRLGIGGFEAMNALSSRNDAPQEASRPFDRERDGFVLGEGAGVLVLEAEEHARRRGASPLAELIGYAANSNASHLTQPPEEGIPAALCIEGALRDASLEPTEVEYVNAHGTSTPLNDVHETRALKRAFGAHASRLAISSTKSMTGHLLGAAGSVEAALTILTLARGVIPPTINQRTADPDCDLDYVPNTARERRVRTALSLSFGFGGTNAVLAFASPGRSGMR